MADETLFYIRMVGADIDLSCELKGPDDISIFARLLERLRQELRTQPGVTDVPVSEQSPTTAPSSLSDIEQADKELRDSEAHGRDDQ